MTFLTCSCPWVLDHAHCGHPEATLWLALSCCGGPMQPGVSLPLAGARPAFHPTFASLCLRSLPWLFSGWSPALPTTWHKAETGKARVEGSGPVSLRGVGSQNPFPCQSWPLSSLSLSPIVAIKWVLCQVSGRRAVTFIQLLLSARACAVCFHLQFPRSPEMVM